MSVKRLTNLRWTKMAISLRTLREATGGAQSTPVPPSAKRSISVRHWAVRWGRLVQPGAQGGWAQPATRAISAREIYVEWLFIYRLRPCAQRRCLGAHGHMWSTRQISTCRMPLLCGGPSRLRMRRWRALPCARASAIGRKDAVPMIIPDCPILGFDA